MFQLPIPSKFNTFARRNEAIFIFDRRIILRNWGDGYWESGHLTSSLCCDQLGRSAAHVLYSPIESIPSLSNGFVYGFDNQPSPFGGDSMTYLRQRCVRGLAGFPSLPNDCSEGEYDGPCGDAFRPSKEYVPPWQVVLSACSFFFAGYLLFRRNRESGAIFCAVSFILFGGTMLFVGHERYPNYQGDYYPRYPPPCTGPNLHGPKIVPQNIDHPILLGYSNHIEGRHGNVLGTDKQIAIIAALTEGSSIRHIERMTGVHL